MATYRKMAGLAAAILTSAAVLVSAGCSDAPKLDVSQVKSDQLLASIESDKAAYHPGETVQLALQLSKPIQKGRLHVRYRYLDETVKEQTIEISSNSNELKWEWTPPQNDFKGYMVEAFLEADGQIKDHVNVAVDVSSDWSKFPRYGYLADFHAMSKEDMSAVIERLNRFHINGIQFYDWQYKHHNPLKWDGGKLAAQWPDIAGRIVAQDTVKGYIDLAHEKNIKAMNYNLLFGAYEDAEADGISKAWALYKDPLQKTQDKHPLPSSWASDIMLYDPSNPEWQQYLIDKEKQVFNTLPFDGWHVDQLGDRGSLFNAKGEAVMLPNAYADFLKNAKEELDVDYVMNAVGQYGQAFIASQAPVDFLYTEVWGGQPRYNNLKDIVEQNWRYSKNKLNTVLAAYMDYKLSDSKGEFNTPGVLLTNAVIFAAGGSHLELGENMLSKEYFPHNNLTIPADLEGELIHYYDFLTAYQNVLRDGASATDLTPEGIDGAFVSKEAEKGKIWSFSRKVGDRDVLHFINLADAVTLDWNDTFGKQTMPQEKKDIGLTMKMDQSVAKMWLASPDMYDGSATPLQFEQKNGVLSWKLPSLKYWDMVVIEYKK